MHLTGRCAYPGCPDASCRTSRLTAVGSNWLGGAEHYQPHCLYHHAQMDIFHAPIHLLHDTDWYINHIDSVLQHLGISIKEFAKAANTTTIALRREQPIKTTMCQQCGGFYCDEGKASEWATYIHICPRCGYTCSDDDVAVATPLAIFNPYLHPLSGRLVLTLPDEPTGPHDHPPGFPPSPPPSSKASKGKSSISLGRGRPLGEASGGDLPTETYWPQGPMSTTPSTECNGNGNGNSSSHNMYSELVK